MDTAINPEGGHGHGQSRSSSIVQQVLPVMMMQSLMAFGVGKKEGSSSNGGLKNIILLDVTTRLLPFMGGLIKSAVCSTVQRRSRRLMEMMMIKNGADKLRKRGSLILEQNTGSSSDDAFEAILAHVSDLPQTRFVRRVPGGLFKIETNDDIPIGDGFLFRRVTSLDASSSSSVELVELFSYDHDIVRIRDFLATIETKYRILKDNHLGRNLYYFDEVVQAGTPDISGKVDLSRLHPNLYFKMYPLLTHKSLRHVFGRSMRSVLRRVEFFNNNRSWYETWGVPYTLGILLHGQPGCGKTSFIKGIARDTGRHIINIKLKGCTTVEQFTNLFYSGVVHVVASPSSATYRLGLDRVIVVLEDVDCLSDVLNRRRTKPKDAKGQIDAQSLMTAMGDIIDLGIPSTTKEQLMFIKAMERLTESRNEVAASVAEAGIALSTTTWKKNPAPAPVTNDNIIAGAQRLNLSTILNVLDGILETPGRILVMTSNHPELLDPALVRPGRIDAVAHFTRCCREDVEEILTSICGAPLTEKQRLVMEDFPEYVWSPADVTQVIFEHDATPDSVDAILAQLVAGRPRVNDDEDEEGDNLICDLAPVAAPVAAPDPVAAPVAAPDPVAAMNGQANGFSSWGLQ